MKYVLFSFLLCTNVVYSSGVDSDFKERESKVRLSVADKSLSDQVLDRILHEANMYTQPDPKDVCFSNLQLYVVSQLQKSNRLDVLQKFLPYCSLDCIYASQVVTYIMNNLNRHLKSFLPRRKYDVTCQELENASLHYNRLISGGASTDILDNNCLSGYYAARYANFFFHSFDTVFSRYIFRPQEMELFYQSRFNFSLVTFFAQKYKIAPAIIALRMHNVPAVQFLLQKYPYHESWELLTTTHRDVLIKIAAPEIITLIEASRTSLKRSIELLLGSGDAVIQSNDDMDDQLYRNALEPIPDLITDDDLLLGEQAEE